MENMTVIELLNRIENAMAHYRAKIRLGEEGNGVTSYADELARLTKLHAEITYFQNEY